MIISVEGSTANSPGAAGAALEQPLCSRRSRRGRVCRAAKPRGRGTGAKIPSARFHSCEPRGPLTQITERNCSKQISEPRLIKNSTASKKKQNHFFIQMLHSGLVVTAHPLMGRVRLARCQRGGSHGSVRRVALVWCLTGRIHHRCSVFSPCVCVLCGPQRNPKQHPWAAIKTSPGWNKREKELGTSRIYKTIRNEHNAPFSKLGAPLDGSNLETSNWWNMQHRRDKQKEKSYLSQQFLKPCNKTKCQMEL